MEKEESIETLRQETQLEISRLKQENKELKERTEALEKQVQLQVRDIEYLHHKCHTVPVDIIMQGFMAHKSAEDRWFAPPFFTHACGYKMCLRVDANGYGTARGSHVSVALHLMQGNFDGYLEWPFRGEVTVQLLNQLEDKDHHTVTIAFTDQTHHIIAGRLTDRKKGSGQGQLKFIGHRKLQPTSSCQYLKNDCLCLRVSKVALYTPRQ